jgi:hypothetical protein
MVKGKREVEMKKGYAMMKEIEWKDTGQEIIARFKVSKSNARKLKELAETGRFIYEINGKQYSESPYAIVDVTGRVATFSAIYEDLEDQSDIEEYAWGLIVADMNTIGAKV